MPLPWLVESENRLIHRFPRNSWNSSGFLKLALSLLLQVSRWYREWRVGSRNAPTTRTRLLRGGQIEFQAEVVETRIS
jgi:hypothetical protein